MTRILWSPSHPSLGTHPHTKIALLLILIVFTLHFFISSHSSPNLLNSPFALLPKHSFQDDDSPENNQAHFKSITCNTNDTPSTSSRANATMLMLTRNSDLYQAIQSVKAIQDRFNNRHRYPWVFLNEVPFTEEFQTRIRDVILGPAPPEGRSEEDEKTVEFGLIPHEHWFQPDWIDEKRASAGRWELLFKGIIYADSVPYRNMCRFNSGFFYRHELLQKYQWYWRVEPGVNFFCDIDDDPFIYMEQNNKTYGFTISMEEFRETIPSLWSTVKDFVARNPHHVAENNAMGFLSSNDGAEYNLCHFWSNFEIASMDFFRAPAYTAYFETLDATGNFYYERWGDAPVHSIAAGLFLDKKQIHFFSDIGYRHDPFQHCPQGESNVKGRCSCNPKDNYDYTGASCLARWEAIFK